MKKILSILILTIKTILVMTILAVVAIIGINLFVVGSASGSIVGVDEATEFGGDCIIVLGAAVWGDKPSHMLEDRLLCGVDLYNKGASKKLLMSGDHGTRYYDEVGAMKKFAVDMGVSSKDVFMDHAGFSTYDSVYRAKEIFKAKRVIIVTQKYHLYRAVYLAKSMGLEVVGVPSDPRSYIGQAGREFREILARVKDVYLSITKPASTKLGKKIPLDNDGNITND